MGRKARQCAVQDFDIQRKTNLLVNLFPQVVKQ